MRAKPLILLKIWHDFIYMKHVYWKDLFFKTYTEIEDLGDDGYKICIPERLSHHYFIKRCGSLSLWASCKSSQK